MSSSESVPAYQLKAFRFQLQPKPAQSRQLARWSGQLRWIWNHALAEQRARHARAEKYASYVDMAKWLTGWRHSEATAWLAEGPNHPQQQVLKRLDEAYQRFFKKTGGFPKFKKHGFDPGIRFPDPKQFELASNERIKLPKLGWIRLRLSRPVEGELRNISISKEGDRWYASIQARTAACLPAAGLQPTLGIDLGVAAFAATSAGLLVAPLNCLKRQQQRLRRYQRAVARKVKGSCNRKKSVKRLAALHRRIARQRSDWLHQLTTRLASEHAVIAIEDLKVKNMSASASGCAAEPGKQVKQKSGLNRSILDQAWGEFARQLGYKLAANGGELVEVNPAYSSRTCRLCQHESADNRKTQSLFACVACGHTEHADIHASKVILQRGVIAFQGRQEKQTAAGHAVATCGLGCKTKGGAKLPAAARAKQEPTEAIELARRLSMLESSRNSRPYRVSGSRTAEGGEDVNSSSR